MEFRLHRPNFDLSLRGSFSAWLSTMSTHRSVRVRIVLNRRLGRRLSRTPKPILSSRSSGTVPSGRPSEPKCRCASPRFEPALFSEPTQAARPVVSQRQNADSKTWIWSQRVISARSRHENRKSLSSSAMKPRRFGSGGSEGHRVSKRSGWPRQACPRSDAASSKGQRSPVQPVQCGAGTMANMGAMASEFTYVVESKGPGRVRIPLSPPNLFFCFQIVTGVLNPQEAMNLFISFLGRNSFMNN